MAGARVSAPAGEAQRIVVWALATFHASGFVLAIVLFAYSRDALGPALSGLNTMVGLGLFVALWATTYVTTSRALRGLDVLGSPRDRELYGRRTLRCGAANGLAFLGILAVVIVFSFVFTAPGILLTVVFAAPFAIAVAAVVGAVVGVIFGIVDLGLFALAGMGGLRARPVPRRPDRTPQERSGST
jgi:hypothetical protein